MKTDIEIDNELLKLVKDNLYNEVIDPDLHLINVNMYSDKIAKPKRINKYMLLNDKKCNGILDKFIIEEIQKNGKINFIVKVKK